MANDHDGNPGGQQKSPEELEREERMRLAMIEELGIHRLDELPMEDTHKASYDDRHPRKPQLEERPSRRNRGKDVILASGDLGSVWQAAIKDGVFEDDDAAGVRGLDDLGGARRYDTAPARTRRLLNVMNNNMMPSARRRTKVASINVMQAISSNAPISMGNNPDKEQRHPRRAVAAPPAPAPQQQLAAPVVNPSLPTANVTGAADAANAVVPESEDTLLRTEVLFRRPNETSPMPSTVLLSSGGPPSFGHFTVLVNDVKFCQWAIATYDDYLNSEDLEVCFLFHHGLGYSFTFKTQDQLVRFLNVLKDLKKAAVTGICLTSHPLPVQQSTTVAAPLPQAPTIQKPVPEPGLPAIPRTAPPSPPDLLTSNTQICQSQEIVRPTTQAPEARAKLVSLDAESASTAPSRALSEASELLSTVEPYDSTKKTELQSPASFIKSIRAVARVFLGTFYLNGKAGQTKAEIAETIQGIREGIIQHFEDDETLTVEERQLIEPALRPSALATDQAKPLSPTTSTSSGSSRIQYDSDEMKAMRENAVAPSTDLGSLKFLPKPGEPKVFEPQPGPSVRVWESSQLVASTSAMDWVMGAEAKPADESAEKQPLEDQVVKATEGHKPVAAAQQPNKADVGLQQSRWAKPGAEIQQANAFTGGQYEKFWKQGSYYYDLIVLDRNAQLGCTSTETIMDMFYPETHGEIAMPSNSSQPRLRSDSQLISIETASTGSTDHVEHLRRGIERMTIRSQRGASAASSRPGSEAQPSTSFMPLAPLPNQPVRQPVQPPAAKGLRGLGASRHSGGNAPVTSGKFDFVLPKSGGK
ncbi:hypothetical protein QBC42DRAFT_191020 [Cladorrhinum samala]|uniref:WH1 domain-containing protein n=1 Tax=Cladorrhinum samala TaxID=585594 RepID=A0AAV9H959_9PEZI|nr:hypothetical protein QBC42DRAFT_191020 [Cladorrhinum samala]